MSKNEVRRRGTIRLIGIICVVGFLALSLLLRSAWLGFLLIVGTLIGSALIVGFMLIMWHLDEIVDRLGSFTLVTKRREKC